MESHDESGPERTHGTNDWIWKVLAVLAGLALAFGCGAVFGGGTVYLVTRIRVPEPAALVKPVPQEGEGAFLSRSSGAIVVEVTADSPAAKAGLERGDLILAVDDQKLDAQHDLADVIAGYQPGDTVRLTVERPGEGERTVDVVLGSNPEKDGLAYLGVRYTTGPHLEVPGSGETPFGGFQERNPEDMPFVLPEAGAMSGVLVLQVAENSPAAAAGLQPGDLVTSFEGEPLDSAQALVVAVAEHEPGDSVSLTVRRFPDGEERQIEVTLGPHPDDEGKAYLGVALGPFFGFEASPEPQPPEIPPDSLRFELPLPLGPAHRESSL
jgi:membrane-associated protease RseP (regulator of RpoE activity)